MPLSNLQYESVLREYEERQLNNRYLLDKRFQEVYDIVPGYRDLEDEVAAVSVSQGKKLLFGDEDALTELKDILKELSRKKAKLLSEAGFSEDYLFPVFVCSDCKDTGYIEGKKCHCLKQAITSLLYEQSNMRELLQKENFDTLSYEYYEGQDLSHFEKAVTTCKNFVKNFETGYHNLFFYGTVGTGKSFLSCCVAKEMIEKGHSVLYFSAIQLFETISRHSFDYKEKEELNSVYDDLYNTDLLIIDDLGTEMTNKFVSSQLFSCLNERHLRKKATIISTNLSLGELREVYSERIFSRITSNYEVCKLSGQDIRMHKKRLHNRK